MRPMMRLVLGLAALGGILAAVAVGLPAHVTVARSVVTNAPEIGRLSLCRQSASLPRLVAVGHAAIRNCSSPIPVRNRARARSVDWVSQVRSIGTGSMEITNADPNKTIELAVNFNGVEGTSTFDISPSGSGSKVTWSFGYEFRVEPGQALEGSRARWLRRSRVSRGPRQAEG